MIAVEIYAGKTYTGALVTPDIHPAALMCPTRDKAEVGVLLQQIQDSGWIKPLVMTPHGQLLEGRGRWKVCRRLDIAPETRIERGDPWLYILEQNREWLRSLSLNHRAMIVGRIPNRGVVGNVTAQYGDPPARESISQIVGISKHTISRGQLIFAEGVGSLHRLVSEDRVALYTAVRVTEEYSAQEQEVFVNRVRNGENPRLIAPVEKRHGVPRPPEGDLSRPRDHAPAPIRGKHRFVRAPAIRQLLDALSALDLVINAAEGLDPTITPKEAGEWIRELADAHPAYRHAIDLLKKRQKETDS